LPPIRRLLEWRGGPDGIHYSRQDMLHDIPESVDVGIICSLEPRRLLTRITSGTPSIPPYSLRLDSSIAYLVLDRTSLSDFDEARYFRCLMRHGSDRASFRSQAARSLRIYQDQNNGSRLIPARAMSGTCKQQIDEGRPQHLRALIAGNELIAEIQQEPFNSTPGDCTAEQPFPSCGG